MLKTGLMRVKYNGNILFMSPRWRETGLHNQKVSLFFIQGIAIPCQLTEDICLTSCTAGGHNGTSNALSFTHFGFHMLKITHILCFDHNAKFRILAVCFDGFEPSGILSNRVTDTSTVCFSMCSNHRYHGSFNLQTQVYLQEQSKSARRSGTV